MTTAKTDVSKNPRNQILRCLTKKPLIIDATDGTETIPNAEDVFTGWINSEFYSLGAGDPTPKTPVMVYEMVKDATFAQMFRSLGVPTKKLCLTQSQIIGFVKKHLKHLRTAGRETFFLFESKRKLFIARVRLDNNDIDPGADVDRFEDDDIWDADDHPRVVVPQL